MTGFPCEDCGKVFSLKTDLERHQNKKTPCVSKEKIINSHVNIIVEKSTNVEQINKVKKFLNFCHDMLRDKEGIVGMKALSNISMLLFLKFVSNSVKSGSIDLLQIEKYRKEEGTDKNEMFQKYKDYVKYAQYSNIIENGKLKVDSTELPIIIEYVFRHIIWHHPKTKNIFIDEIPNIKNDITYEQIFKQLDKLNWDDFDIDVKGLAYEHFLKDEMGGGDLGQFFTKREIVDYMINVIKPEIKETSTFIDPFMGTGGFITHIYNELKSLYKKNKIPFTDEIKNNLINGIEKNPQTC
jgi:type I restriction-modification system DNA methylase subunit